jgi:hypothetical protein
LTPRFIEGDHTLLDRQIRFAWRSRPEQLAGYAKVGGPDVVRIMRKALLDQPDDLRRFEELIR